MLDFIIDVAKKILTVILGTDSSVETHIIEDDSTIDIKTKKKKRIISGKQKIKQKETRLIAKKKNVSKIKKRSSSKREDKSQKRVKNFVENNFPDYSVERATDVPDSPRDRIIYIVGEDGFDWQCAFKCPCGCGDLIQLSLLERARYTWRVKWIDEKRITITPSINRQVGCLSHFNITGGNVKWWGKY